MRMRSIPVLVLQTLFNDAMDRRLGLPFGALIRLSAGLGSLALLMSFFTLLATSHQALITATGGRNKACKRQLSN